MIEGLILIEGKDVKGENLMISLGNAKQVLLESAVGFGIILHVSAASPDYLSNALLDLSSVIDVTGVATLMLRSSP